MTKIVRVSGKTFCAGAVIEEGGKIGVVAPYLRKLISKAAVHTAKDLANWARRRGYKIEVVA